jgi:phosphoribosylformimino-5-aminoimidazole carboxamide ribonucleotide (ProFAR) isomerase
VRVSLQVIPAIDIAEGHLARLSGQGIAALDVFGGDPVAAARAFVQAGAPWIHVVDLDMAVSGEPRNLALLTDIAALGVPVQASGGITTDPQVAQALSAGASRVVVGSAAFAFRDATAELVSARGDAVAVGIEADGPTLRPRGRGAGDAPLWEALEWLAGLDVARYVYTEVGRVDGLGGPDLDGIWALATHTGRPVIASGGIRGHDDLRAIAALGAGIEGVVVGRALYEGLDLAEAIAAVR